MHLLLLRAFIRNKVDFLSNIHIFQTVLSSMSCHKHKTCTGKDTSTFFVSSISQGSIVLSKEQQFKLEMLATNLSSLQKLFVKFIDSVIRMSIVGHLSPEKEGIAYYLANEKNLYE